MINEQEAKERIDAFRIGVEINNFSKDEIDKLERFVELLTRQTIIRKNLKSMDDLYDEYPEMFNKDSMIGLALMTQSFRVWDNEVLTEIKSLEEDVTKFIYRESVIDMINRTTVNLQKFLKSNTGLPESVSREFLNKKYGEEPSPSKDAMKEILVECLEFFINAVLDGTILEGFKTM